MSSPEPFSIENVDLLVAQALRDEVSGAMPPHRVWRRIRRDVQTITRKDEPRRSTKGWGSILARFSPGNLSTGLAPIAQEGLDPRLVAVRFLDYYGGSRLLFCWQ